MYKHGVYVTEKATSLTAPVEGTAGLQVIVGTAPVNLADDPYSVANKPVICYSFEEAAKKLGYSDNFADYTLCQSVSACFRVFNVAPIVLINVLDPRNSAHVEAVSGASVAVTSGKAVIAVKGILLDTLEVSGGSELEEGIDYGAAFDDDGNVVITLADTVSDSSITVSYTKLKPSGVTADDIIGGSSGEKGLEVIRQVYPKLGLTPGLILAPGWSHIPAVAAAMQAKCEGINGCFDCETIIDISSRSSDSVKALAYDGVKSAKESTGISSVHALAVWPMCLVGDVKYYMSALMGALIAYTDASNDDVPSLTMSNKSLKVTGICLADGSEVLLDQQQANIVNSFGVVTAINANGFKAWGSNSAAYPSTTDPKDRWFNCRRFFSWWGNSIILTYFQKVDDPADYRLIESIVDSENIRGNSYVARGYCAEARVEFLADENPVTDILGGKLQFHVYLAPYTPAEDIEFVLEFDPTAIEIALTGGE